MGSLYNAFRYKIVPPLFLAVFTASVQFFAHLGRSDSLSAVNLAAVGNSACGNAFAWKCLVGLIAWVLAWLWCPSAQYRGPKSPTGVIPVYQDNGLLFYAASITAFLLLEFFNPTLSLTIYKNFPEILGSLNIFALIFCLYLFLKGREEPNDVEIYPTPYLFYRGRDFHPRILGVDVKQFAAARMGMIMWALLNLIFFIAACRIRSRFCYAEFASMFLQNVFLVKFYYWETGYFNTLDIILDRAGYYICWGCLVWVPCFYTYSLYFMVYNQPTIEDFGTTILIVVGLLAIYANYDIDAQRQEFRAKSGKCQIWGRPAQFITAVINKDGRRTERLLLTSGYWGCARHLNYTSEIISSTCWCAPGLGLGPYPFLYVFYLTILFVHRTFRDEEKCSKQYGKYWTMYCERVPYRMVPYIF